MSDTPENPYEQLPDLHEMQEEAMAAAQESLEGAGCDVKGLVLIISFTHPELEAPEGAEALNMAAFHPYGEWEQHLKLVSETLEITKQVAASGVGDMLDRLGDERGERDGN